MTSSPSCVEYSGRWGWAAMRHSLVHPTGRASPGRAGHRATGGGRLYQSWGSDSDAIWTKLLLPGPGPVSSPRGCVSTDQKAPAAGLVLGGAGQASLPAASAIDLRRCSASWIAHAALTRPMWLNACG